MKNRNNNIIALRPTLIHLMGVILFWFCIHGCMEDPEYHPEKSNNQVIADYVATHSDQFSEFAKLLENTGLKSLLSIRGPFTLLLPTDDAMKAYYAEKNVASLDALSDEFQQQLLKNHLIAAEIKSNSIGLGALIEENALGDRVASEFRDSETNFNKQSETYLNKHSKIIKRDIKASNGYIHVIDKVIDIETENAYQKLISLGKYSLFAKGLELTGLKDTLQIIDFPYGNKTARTHFTILAITDSLFNANGIFNINDLINRYTDQPDQITKINNGFYRYMEYHCLSETYFLSDFPVNDGLSKLYPILSYDNNVSLIINDDYKLNSNSKEKTYTAFDIPESNYPCKNAAIHTIKGLLEVIQPAPATLTFEPTDYFDLKQGDYYGKYYMKWSDGQNTFKNIKWEGDYLQYYYKDHGTGQLLNHDCLNMNGFWWIEITTPKIMKGKYSITGNIWSNWVDYDVYVDGVYSCTMKRADDANSKAIAVVNWESTETHKVKLVAVSFGILFWDTLVFTPM